MKKTYFEKKIIFDFNVKIDNNGEKNKNKINTNFTSEYFDF